MMSVKSITNAFDFKKKRCFFLSQFKKWANHLKDWTTFENTYRYLFIIDILFATLIWLNPRRFNVVKYLHYNSIKELQIGLFLTSFA